MRLSRWSAAIASAMLMSSASAAVAQDTLGTARARYAAARYEHALEALAAPVAAADAVEADRLRALCLLALGRPDEADQAIARVVIARPREAVPGDASPRVRSAFLSVRDRVLPEAATTYYETGKEAFARRDFAIAVAEFERALPLLEILALEGHRDMESRRVLASDFLVLGRRQMPAPAPPAPPVLTSRATDLSQAVPAVASTPRMPQTPPMVLRQEMPLWPHVLGTPYATFRGTIDVTISAEGYVVNATIVKSIHPLYDQELLRAARAWRYEPARRGGRPVESIKRVDVEIGK